MAFSFFFIPTSHRYFLALMNPSSVEVLKRKGRKRDFLESSGFKTSPSSARGVGWIPGQGGPKVTHTSQPKTPSIKQKQYLKKSNKDPLKGKGRERGEADPQ